MLVAILALSANSVDYSCRAQRIEVALVELAKATGLKLAVSSGLRDDVIVIDVHGVTSEHLLEKVAFVLRADWHTRDGVRILERGAARQTRNEREDEQTLKSMLTREFDAAFPGAREPIPQQAIEQLALDLSLVGKLGEREDDARIEWYGIDPLIRAVPKLLDSLDWSVVRRAWGAHAVFASLPDVYEAALDKPTTPRALAGIVQDLKAIKVVCDRRGVKLSADWGTSPWERAAAFATTGGARLYFRTGLPHKSVGITITDAKGSEWLTQGTGSKSGSRFPAAEEIGFDPRSVVDVPFFSDRTIRFADLMRDHRKLPDAELLAELTDPLEFDPHSYADTDFVRTLGTQLKANVVVALSDLDRIVDYYRGRRDGSLVEGLVPFLDLHQTKLEDGWLTARPRVLAGHEHAKLNRRAFAGMLAELKTKGTLDLEKFAAAMSPAPSFSFQIFTSYIKASAPNFPINDDYDGAPLEFGSFYRALSEPERQRVLTTGLLVKGLGPRATDAFRFHIWPVVESQVTYDPEHPRPYHGWTHPETLPPDDLTVKMKLQRLGEEVRAFKEGKWAPVPERDEFVSFLGKRTEREFGDALFNYFMERDFKGLQTQRTVIVRLVFEFTSREWRKSGEIGFTFPVGAPD